MGENVDPKWLAMAGEFIDWYWNAGASGAAPGVRLAALLSQVDAEATERAAKVCNRCESEYAEKYVQAENQGRFDDFKLFSALAVGAGACASAIRSTLPTPAAQEAQKP